MTTALDSLRAVRRCGHTGLLLEVESNRQVHLLAEAVRAAQMPGVVDVIGAMDTVLVRTDPTAVELNDIHAQIEGLRLNDQQADAQQAVTLPVTYDGSDLGFVADYLSMSPQAVIDLHTAVTWNVAFCGFAPGFAYLTAPEVNLDIPRQGESRLKVPAGSVGLAGAFSSVYPRESPGGWQLIGTTTATLWDVNEDPPSILTPGTQVRFERVPQ